MSVGDKILTCRDCGTSFVFTAGEQIFYAERGFAQPARCPSCRAARRQARAAEASGETVSPPPAPRPPRQFYPVVCASCGRETMVPFEPRTGRPVYCRECYQRLRAVSSGPGASPTPPVAQ
ncbi:MAG: zinc-ribbon domain containing protein [Thermomicrobiaceae bacterium]|nr:zinc-ribbon domain containing protein [Thermomicrobiaceae bacterium]